MKLKSGQEQGLLRQSDIQLRGSQYPLLILCHECQLINRTYTFFSEKKLRIKN